MIQRFIELGEGYSDLYELLEIAKANQERITHMLQFETIKNEKKSVLTCCNIKTNYYW